MAEYNKGLNYHNGEGVAQNFQQAAVFFRKSAEQGYAEAQYNLATMYAQGKGVPQDDRRAMSWYRNAAAQGIIDAQYNLGAIPGNDVMDAGFAGCSHRRFSAQAEASFPRPDT